VTESDFQIFDVVGALVVVLDVDGRIVYWNQCCSALTDYSLDQIRGRRLWDFALVPEEVVPVRAVLAKLRAAEMPGIVANHWVTKTGERRWIAWSHTLTTRPDGRRLWLTPAWDSCLRQRLPTIAAQIRDARSSKPIRTATATTMSAVESKLSRNPRHAMK
jgi:PAS domain S-box-containing protein